MRKIPPGVGPRFPQVVVLFGATGDLAHRKLLPGLFRLSGIGFIPDCRIIGVSLEDIDADGFRAIAHTALDEFSTRKVTDEEWKKFSAGLDYVPLKAGASALRAAVQKAEKSIAGDSRRLHYLSVPPSAALSAVRMLA
jgi:glucose-6-phosphate 1-dehydrogenase